MEEMTGSSSSGVSGKKRLWTEVEDNILVDYVSKHGDSNWSNVQRVTGLSRTGKSCRLRWRDQLRPGLKKEQFSSEEEKLIGDLHYKMGNQWAVIAQYLPGRTDNAVKNFWYNRCKRRKRTASKVDAMDPSGAPLSCPPEMVPHSAPLLPSLSERLELTSIQHVETHQGLADKADLLCFMEGRSSQYKDFVDPISSFGSSLLPNFAEFSIANTSSASNAGQFSLYTFPECYDGLADPTLTDGDIVDFWLNSSSLDRSLDQECIFQEAICANDGDIGSDAVATSTGEFYQESTGSIVGAMAEDEMDAVPDLLHSSSSDMVVDHESMCQDTTIHTNNGTTINNVAGWANDEPIKVEPNNWYSSSSADDFLYQEGILQDVILFENDGTFNNFAASSTSCMHKYGWDQTYIFWSTPFFSEID